MQLYLRGLEIVSGDRIGTIRSRSRQNFYIARKEEEIRQGKAKMKLDTSKIRGGRGETESAPILDYIEDDSATASPLDSSQPR
jgi:hypothetical protein